MCKAVREMNEKAAKNAAEKARLETLRDSVKNLMDSLQVSIEAAMKTLKICNEDQAILRKMM